MNPAQYKLAMQQRALERQAENDELVARETRSFGEFSAASAAGPIQQSFCASYPPPAASSNATRGRSLLPKLELQGSERFRENLVSFSEGGGPSKTGLEIGGVQLLGQQLDELNVGDQGESPLAPKHLSGRWGSAVQLTGLDKQGGVHSTADTGGLSLDDIWGEGEDDAGFASDTNRRHVRALDWTRLPGETIISQGVRLYLCNLDHDATHEENCALVLHPILERVAREELDVPTLKTRHVIKMEAFLRSVVLSVPAKTWQQSVRGAFARTVPVGHVKSPGHGHQISKDELTFRMGLFVSVMKAERNGGGAADIAVDPMRVESVVRGYALNAAEIMPLQRPSRTFLPPLLFCMACEVLNVRLLAPEVRDVCRQIVSDYEARAKLWMSPAQNAERYLRPVVTEFLSWIRANTDILYQGSATEGLLRSIHESLRSNLKNQVYRSPEHFLRVINSLSAQLTDMPLPSYDPAGGDNDHPFDVSQTLKDISRERFDVNNVTTDPSDCWPKIRALLLKGALEHPSYNAGGGMPKHGGAADAGSGPGGEPTGGEVGHSDNGPGGDVPSLPVTLEAEASNGRSATACTASGDAAGGKGLSPGAVDGEGEGGSGKRADVKSWGKGDPRRYQGVAKSGLEMYVDQCAWRVLHAASRTASGGDCFFVVQDLFGGEGVLVKMATAATEPIRIRTKGLAARVTTVDKHDIYHTSDLDMNSSCSDSSPRPLMTITTTMKEVIQFAPYANTPSRRESWLFATAPSSDTPEECANVQPSHASSGRFITISADLPDYPENHLDASAGVLEVPSDSSLSTGQAPRHDPAEETSLSDNTPSATKNKTAVTSSQSQGGVPRSSPPPPIEGPGKGIRGSRQRPSTFTSPPPAPVPASWKERMDRDTDWGGDPRSEVVGNSEEGPSAAGDEEGEEEVVEQGQGGSVR